MYRVDRKRLTSLACVVLLVWQPLVCNLESASEQEPAPGLRQDGKPPAAKRLNNEPLKLNVKPRTLTSGCKRLNNEPPKLNVKPRTLTSGCNA